jgi:hypothetical protein
MHPRRLRSTKGPKSYEGFSRAELDAIGAEHPPAVPVASPKPKLAAVENIAALRAQIEITGEVYTIQGLADGARALIQRFYESYDDDPDTLPLLQAMRILDVADERLDRLGERVEGLESREVAHG